MEWYFSYGLIVVALPFVFLYLASIWRSDEDDEVQSSIANGMKVYLVFLALLSIMVGVGSLPNLIDVAHSEDRCGIVLNNTIEDKDSGGLINLTYIHEYKCFEDGSQINTSQVSDLKSNSNTLFTINIYLLIPLVFLLLILLIYFVARFFTAKKTQGGFIK